MIESPRVVVVEDTGETSTVLKAMLEPRGTSVSAVHNSKTLNQQTNSDLPNVLVVHGKCRIRSTEWSRLNSVPQIVIGKNDASDQGGANNNREYFPDFFQYGDLIAAVERLLDTQHDSIKRPVISVD